MKKLLVKLEKEIDQFFALTTRMYEKVEKLFNEFKAKTILLSDGFYFLIAEDKDHYYAYLNSEDQIYRIPKKDWNGWVLVPEENLNSSKLKDFDLEELNYTALSDMFINFRNNVDKIIEELHIRSRTIKKLLED